MSEYNHLTRRTFLRWTALAGTGVLAACAPKVVKETVVVEKPVEKVVKETVIVAGTPQVVEKEKVVTKEVVKEVAAKTAEELLPAKDKLGSPDKPKGWKTTLPDLPAGVPYKDPVVITCTRRVDAQTTFCEGDDLQNNPWSRMIEALFNVKYEVAWTWSTSDEQQQKYNLASASGDIPDFLETVPESIFLKMVEAEQLEDLTDAYDQYASPRWKAIWREYGELPWTWSKVDGRIYGIPRVEDLAHNDCLMWYRQDWFDKLGKPVPTTFEEVHDAAVAFNTGDYGMGAKGSTIGLLWSNAIYATWYGSMDFFWGGYGYLPQHWQPEGDKLMYGATRPEVKEALAVLAQWYKDGVFAKDFYTYDTSKAMQNVAANLNGFHFTPSWGANLDSVKNDPKCVWKVAEIPAGPKGFRRRHTENNFRDGPFAFKKGAKGIDVIFTVTDWWDQLWHDPWRRMHGWEDCNYSWDGDKIKPASVSFQNWTPGFVGTRGSGFLDPKQPAIAIRYYYDEWNKIAPEKRDAQQEYFLNDPYGVVYQNNMCRLKILETADQGVMTKLQHIPFPTDKSKGADLAKMRDQAFINIIIGQQPISDWDVFVDQWTKGGGGDWTNEVNEWWATATK